MQTELQRHQEPVTNLDPAKIYALAELIDIAEQHNPETGEAWERSKRRAAELGVAKGALYPTVAAAVVASSARVRILFGDAFFRQTLEAVNPALSMEYLLLDFGARRAEIDVAKAELLAANLEFNDVHRTVIFEVMTSYFSLLDDIGQEGAAQATLENARSSAQAVDARRQNGLATLPDALEAKAALAEAEYQLASIRGAQEIARGELATLLGVPVGAQFKVQDLSQVPIPDQLTEPVETMIQRAFAQVPDLLAQLSSIRAAQAAIKRSHSAFLPELTFRGTDGFQRVHGAQEQIPGVYNSGQTWNTELRLNWTLFDGSAREHRLAAAHSQEREAEAHLAVRRDQVALQVWSAYISFRTSLQQRQAAEELLKAADESYTAALEAYRYGVRNVLDIVAAQRTLAQARTAEVRARTQVLTDLATLSYRTGDLLGRHP